MRRVLNRAHQRDKAFAGMVMTRVRCLHGVYRGVLLFAASLAITGCFATTADVVELVDKADDVKTQQDELKSQVVELKKAVGNVMAQQKKASPRYLRSRLDELSVKFEEMEKVLTDLRRDHEDGMRRSTSGVAGVETGMVAEGTAGDLETSSDHGEGTTSCVSSDMPEREPDIQAFGPSGNVTDNQTELSSRELFEVAYQDYQVGDYDSAIHGFEAFQQRFSNAPRAVDVQYLVGTAYFRKGDCVRAIAAYERLVEAFPQHSNGALGMWKLSYLYDEVGDAVQARSVLLRLIERHPRTREAKLARQRLPDISQ